MEYFQSRFKSDFFTGSTEYITLPQTTNIKWEFQCPHGHIHSISKNAFLERIKSLKSQKIKFMCSLCEKTEVKFKQIEKWKYICEAQGFTFISYNDRIVKYICVCGNANQNRDTDIRSFTGCKKCSQTKLNLEDIRKVFIEAKCDLLTTEYKNNKQKLHYRCECGEEGFTILHDFKSGNRCGKCRLSKTKSTCMKLYGVENVFQSKKIQEKSRETCLKKYGTEHHSQHPDVQRKKELSCLKSHGVSTVLKLHEIQLLAGDAMYKKYGVRHGTQSPEILEIIRKGNREKYGTDYLFESKVFWEEWKSINKEKYGVEFHTQVEEWKALVRKIMLEKYGSEYFVCSEEMKKMMLEKYGVEHASQSEELKEKSRETCLTKYGSEYFVCSEEMKKRMLEKYGSEYFVCSEEMKKMMLEKYGVEHASQSEELKEKSRETCLTKYGVEYPMQNYEIFRKAAKSMYTKKLYTLPSGTETLLMGYEWMAFDILLGKTKTSKYTGNIYTEEQFDLIPPLIPYYHSEKQHMYYPDIFVNGIVIEVKSVWTFNLTYEKNHCKFVETAKKYPFQVWIFGKKGLLEIISYSLTSTEVIATFQNGKVYSGKSIKSSTSHIDNCEVLYEEISNLIEEL